MGAVRDHSILIACIGAGSAILAAFAKPICDALSSDAATPASAAVAAAPADPASSSRESVTPTPNIEGVWQQYILSADEGDVYLGTFVVGRANGEYIISPRAAIENERIEQAKGVFDVAYDGQSWTYNSNWGDGRVGNFELQRVSPTVFEGDIRVAGKLEKRTRVVKIE